MTSEKRVENVLELAKKVVQYSRENLGCVTKELISLEMEIVSLSDSNEKMNLTKECGELANVFEKL